MGDSSTDDIYHFNKNGAGKLVGVSVGQLKQILSTYEDDALVVLQKDPEGNGYSPLAFAGADWYVATNTYSGEAYSQEDIDDGEIDLTHEDPDTYDKVLFLGPIN